MKNILLSALAILVILAACSPAAPDQLGITASPPSTTTPTPTPTVVPTATPIPTATATSTPTPDYTLIKYFSLYFNGTSETVLVFTLNGVTGEFRGEGNDYPYTCRLLADQPDKLYCTGAYQAPGREMFFHLYEANQIDPVLSLDIIVPSSLPPTPVGLTCEIEPLFNSGQGPKGCYAITCVLPNGDYWGGTPNNCDIPWPYWP
jgi:hypothetical protein